MLKKNIQGLLKPDWVCLGQTRFRVGLLRSERICMTRLRLVVQTGNCSNRQELTGSDRVYVTEKG